jgi:protein-L-isoaspartate(D-aspartate) O-methyltransferase
MKKFAWMIPLLLTLALTGPASAESPYEERRLDMVEDQMAARGIEDPEVLTAMRQVPRHKFVPEKYEDMAYRDRPLPIGYGQTISQPYMVAYMTETLALKGDEKVLEIGTGSGYQAAVLTRTAGEVYSVEIIPQLHQQAEKRLQEMDYPVQCLAADGYLGWEKHAPYDRIIVTCAAGHIPPPLIKQLKPGGKMVIPVGDPWSVQSLVLARKDESGQVTTKSLMSVRFVPLVRER